MPDQMFRPGEQHPPEWRRDLNPDAMAGQNIGLAGHAENAPIRTAHEAKDVHRRLSGINDAELKQIPILAPGDRLEQGATYIDLRDDDCHEFTATADMAAGRNNAYVPKKAVDYQLWNRLIGVENPTRLGEEDEAAA